jgi:hypothetical protein
MKGKKTKDYATYAHTSWCAEDVLTLRPKWTVEQAEEFLERHSGHIIDGMVSAGWDVIRCALEEKKDDDTVQVP